MHYLLSFVLGIVGSYVAAHIDRLIQSRAKKKGLSSSKDKTQ